MGLFMPSLINRIVQFSAILCLFVSGHFALAVTPTAEQIAQFKSLPQSQQQALAERLGFDLKDDVINTNSSLESESISAPTRVTSTESTPRIKESSGASPLGWFGYDFFSGGTEGFSAIDNIPIPLDYVIGPGDEIQVMVFGKSEKSYRLKVDREGKITFPEFGPEYVAGKTFEEAREHIKELVERKVIGVETEVSLGSIRTMQVFVAGEVKKPGAYNVNGITTISQLLSASGGIKRTGSLRNIQLKRRGKVVGEFDAYDILLKGDVSRDVRLLAGDTLFVPVKSNDVVIIGDVVRPAHYEMSQSKSIKTLINYAGGTKANAFLSQVNVLRYSSTGKIQFTLDLSQPDSWKFSLQNGDQVMVPHMSERLNNAVALRGDVVRQGAYNFKPGMHISDLVSNERRDLKQTAELGYALEPYLPPTLIGVSLHTTTPTTRPNPATTTTSFFSSSSSFLLLPYHLLPSISRLTALHCMSFTMPFFTPLLFFLRLSFNFCFFVSPSYFIQFNLPSIGRSETTPLSYFSVLMFLLSLYFALPLFSSYVFLYLSFILLSLLYFLYLFISSPQSLHFYLCFYLYVFCISLYPLYLLYFISVFHLSLYFFYLLYFLLSLFSFSFSSSGFLPPHPLPYSTRSGRPPLMPPRRPLLGSRSLRHRLQPEGRVFTCRVAATLPRGCL